MTLSHDALQREVAATRRRWLVTGAAGFIGSHLVETLLALGQDVVGLDNFATGHPRNLEDVCAATDEDTWRRFGFIEGDIVDLAACRRACEGVDTILHHAALGSVPRSIADPLATHAANATGFVHMLSAAREAGVRRFVYAASSSTYGDHPALPKVEDAIGRPLSPYAVTKYLNELYADVFARCYGVETIGLRYFNVFGTRQDPEGAYAAVIPRWIRAIVRGEAVTIYGDGETSRDFCFVANAVQANLRAALTTNAAALNQVYNVAVGQRTTLNGLFEALAALVRDRQPGLRIPSPVHEGFRAGDVRHSQADIGKAERLLGYAPTHDLPAGLQAALPWYLSRYAPVGGEATQLVSAEATD
jgi:UDP-N-acetylglucosamine/UDP-N-acetyl-alpha-D-glucosaminouronate 4-epimerase